MFVLLHLPLASISFVSFLPIPSYTIRQYPIKVYRQIPGEVFVARRTVRHGHSLVVVILSKLSKQCTLKASIFHPSSTCLIEQKMASTNLTSGKLQLEKLIR
jgi:hypothetical protein